MTRPRTGPVRSEEVRRAILESTGRLLSDQGYSSLSMEGIAREAGVGKQTLYRWWRSKGDLVAECLLDGLILGDRLRLPDTGDLRSDLRGWLDAIFTVLAEPQGEVLLRSIIAAAAENADVGRRLRESLGGGESPEARLVAAIEAGQLRTDAPRTEIAEALVGAVIIHAVSREPHDPSATARLVDAVLRGNEV